MKKLMKLAFISAIAVATTTCISCGNNPDDSLLYTITVTDDGNGTAVADKTKAEAGTTVTLTATPNEGYTFAQWILLSGDISDSSNETSNPGTFIMPESNVSFKAEFTKSVIPGTSTETTAEFDNSSFGLYKGVVAGSSGTVRIEIHNGNAVAKATLVIDGETDQLTCTTPLTNGQAIIDAVFTGSFSSFTFSVDADGQNPVISNIVIEGHSNVVVSVVKETSADVAYCYEGTSTSPEIPEIPDDEEHIHSGVLNVVRSGNTFSGMQVTTGPALNLNKGLVYPLKGTINSDGTFSESVTVRGISSNPNYDPDVPGSKEIIDIDITLSYSGRFDGDGVSGTWTTRYIGRQNGGTFEGRKTL